MSANTYQNHRREDKELSKKQDFDEASINEEARGDETPDVEDASYPEEDSLDWEDIQGEVLDGEVLEADEEQEADGNEGEDWKDRFLRLSADFDNFRKRTIRDKEDWSRYASQSMMEKLLPIADNLDAAEAAVMNAGAEAQSVAEGLRMIQRQFIEVLSQEGLSEIQALGEVFDPTIHEAVMTVAPADGQRENEVTAVFRKGYMYKDKVLRPSMVQVAKDQ